MGTAVVRTVHGFTMECDLRDWVSQHVFVTGSYEEGLPQVMAQLVRPGSVVVDVGANVGFYTLLLANLAGPTGRVHAFEPMPHALTRLRKHVTMNRLQNVEIHEAAASSSDGTVPFYLGPVEHTSISSLHPLEGSTSIDVQCTTLDRALEKAGPIDFIKMDVEGAEPEALAGAQHLLSRGVPYLVAEVSDSGWPATLIERGYAMYHITWQGVRKVDDPRDPSLPAQYNALFSLGTLPAGVAVL